MSNASLRRQGGYSLLEVLLASVVLLVGVMAVTKLTQGTLNGLTGSNSTRWAEGANQNPLLVDQLLREEVERIRSGDMATRSLTVGNALYHPDWFDEGQLKPVFNGLDYRRYRVEVRMQLREPAGMPKLLVGQVRFDKITGGLPGAGL